MEPKHKQLKAACYTASMSMSVVANLPPLLLLTFRNLYGISYSMLGALILINFLIQLGMDLLFSFFSHKFNIAKTIRFTPVLTCLGLGAYALLPLLFPNAAYAGLVIGTIIFSASAGLLEVLNSPVLATIPFADPDREMSKLHSVYAWGCVAVVLIATLFLYTFGAENWQWLAVLMMVIPLVSVFLFAKVEIPPMPTPEKTAGAISFFKNKSLWLFVVAIFLGGSAECTMGQWASGYLEQAMGIPKVWGDVFGVAFFSIMLGLGRSLYGKIGKNIGHVLFFSSIGATLCYFVAAISNLPLLGLVACALTGLTTAMLWPGCLIAVAERFPAGGVLMYAIMAAGGDLGASLGPQLVGVVTDITMELPFFINLAEGLHFTPEVFGMKLGMLTGMLFPLCSIPLFARIWHNQNQRRSHDMP